MKKRKKPAVKFAQPQSKTDFHRNYSISREVNEMLDEEYWIFTKYVMDRNYAGIYSMLHEYIDDHHPHEEKRMSLEHNLFWWQVLCDSSKHAEMSFVEDYISENFHRLRDRPLTTTWLREWKKAIPKFYYVDYKYSDRVLVVVDLLTEETLDVIVYDPLAVPPKKGEIVMGTLIPIGDALYFPIIDFYHFDFAAREHITRNLHHYYNKHLKNASMLGAFIHVLSIVLQIEQRFLKENTSK
ncbi:hypothetical protein CFK37_06545 [Virgibacillus phasianinus]|uniref:Uncharacterized protein n=1 Tax=Virgibacillus phasianinus TaxID=2017483 RepID=A0A220U1V7_9BACI|nr:hypothetical protein [Virgibacillus phasianinus]ASK61841.1 hypothetical protein CFK37_06545 [Virgibacillus phasianinus]